ncbi:MAG: PD-(D/E)XK nuclease family protein [Pseudomonadota bacterium]
MSGALFGAGGAKIWTVPPGAPFLRSLAQTLVAETGLADNPAALADALIFVPNRRSARALAAELFEAAGCKPILTPAIRPLGDLDADEPFGADPVFAELGPALGEAERLCALARLVSAYYEARGEPLPARSALAAARELAGLLDQAALSGLGDWSRLPELVEEADLAGHWAQSVEFLKIITDHWPGWLKARGAFEPYDRRIKAAEALVRRWAERPPPGIVLIAGSTGATPASRKLMRGALALPGGGVVLPGLDSHADAKAWAGIAEEAGHPQFALAATLADLGVSDPSAVAVWPGESDADAAKARRGLVQKALAPAAATADWRARLAVLAGGEQAMAAFTRSGLDGFDLIEAADEAEEALCAALLLRDALETPGKTAALVTPEPAVARRVATSLKRWGVDCAPSAGAPLLRTPQGSLIALVAAWALDPGDPVALCAVLKHPLVEADADVAAELEKTVLRGVRRWRGLSGLSREGATGALVASLAAKAEPAATLLACSEKVAGAAVAEAIAALAEALAGDEAWMGAAGLAAAGLLDDLAALGGALGGIRPAELSGLLEGLASGRMVPGEGGEHPRIAIWGPLEARLQSADLIILAGLNEGVWPDQPQADAFLPRRFRAALGLPPPEARLGLSAHDFAQLACAPSVVLMSAKRREDAPAVASRWLWRLKTLARAGGAAAALDPGPARDPRLWAAALRSVAPSETCAEPRPRPLAEARPRKLSVTRIGALQRDPYAIYAEAILRLRKLDPLDAPLGPRERGTAIHAALEAFEGSNETSPESLVEKIEAALLEAGATGAELAARRARELETADWYLAWRARRQADVEDVLLERSGRLQLRIGDADFALTAKADRIERLIGGGVAIVDFKTGAPPSDKEIAAGLDQQMPLQALIAREGGFQGLAGAETKALIYVAYKARPEVRHVGESRALNETPGELASAAEAGLRRLMTRFADPATPYLSAPRAQFLKYEGDFDRLARRAEWAGDTSDE